MISKQNLIPFIQIDCQCPLKWLREFHPC